MSEDSDAAENNANQLLNLKSVKDDKDIDDNLSDNKLLKIIVKTNQLMSMALTPFIDNIDLADTKFFDRARNVALTYFDYLYTRRVLKLYTEAHEIKTEFNDDLKVLIKSITAEPGKATRSKIASAGIKYESRLLRNIPGMTDEFGNIIEEFGSNVRRQDRQF